MHLIKGRYWTKIGVIVVALLMVTAMGTMTGSCAGSSTNLCERYDLRCREGQECAANQAVCIPIGGCGNLQIDPGEVCDDGNIMDGDKCSHDCKSTEVCGNKIKDINEDCDGEPNCSSDCHFQRCGNHIVDPKEDCDDFGMDSKGCNFDCTYTICGDGYANIVAGEQCDSKGEIVSWCNGPLCTSPICGDNFHNQAAGEDCDTGGDSLICNGNGNGDTKNDPNSYCKAPMCGDGYTNSFFVPPGATTAEECDDGNDENDDFCVEDCRMATCGDGFVRRTGDSTHPPEQCDDGFGNNNTMKDACRTDCRKAHCGDHVKDSGEDCDPPQGSCGVGKTCNISTCKCENDASIYEKPAE